MANVKKIGTQFEKELVAELSQRGYWVHFLVPDRSGKQPFDVLAVKDGLAYAIDCKTCIDSVFRLNRLEENQKKSFDFWLARGNTEPMVMVKHGEWVYKIRYSYLRENKKVNLLGGEGYEVFCQCPQYERK